MQLTELKEGIRYFLNSTKRKIKRHKRFQGSAKEICEQIVADCWNGKYFENSLGNYKEFWTRDIGFSAENLIKLGYKEELTQTLKYALSRFKNGIKTTITPNGKAFSFPNVYSPDSVALLFYSLRAAKAQGLIEEHREFLQKEVDKFFKTAVDRKTNLIKKERFSSMRDYSIRTSSCYDNCMTALMAKESKHLGFEHECLDTDFSKIIKQHFWTETHFKDELNGKHIAGDANIFPFWTETFNDKKMLKQTIETIKNAKLDTPLPLKYIGSRAREKMHWANIFVPNWEQNYSWTNMAPIYISLVGEIDKKYANELKEKYRQTIERDGTLFELYNDEMKPFKSAFYLADEGMLWAANFAKLL
jgi:hypothetical protein